MEENIKKKLDNLVGRTWMFRTREVTVKSWAVADGSVHIKTQGRDIMMPVSEVRKAEFLEIEGEQADPSEPEKQMAIQVFQGDAEKISNMERVLLDNIQKIDKDPKYLPQAKAITNNVNTLLNMSKLKIEMLKEMRKHRNGNSY